jgi:hypothetical protein
MSNKLIDGDGVFIGSVVDQYLATTEYDELQLILTVEVKGRLHDSRDRSAGTEDVPREQREIRLTFSEAERSEIPTRISVQNLGRLGFTESDLSRLHPDHEEFYSLIGRDVHIRPRERDGVSYWNLCWPRTRPCPAPLNDVAARLPSLQRRIEQLQSNPDASNGPRPESPRARQTEVSDDA